LITRLLVPVEDDEGLGAQVASHFGRAPYFMVIDFQNSQVKNILIEPNTGEHFGGQGHPHEKLLSLKPNIVVAQGMGPGGLQSFRNAGIQVLQTGPGKVTDVVESFQKSKLVELTTGCRDAHHQ
jgi:predicted Fe-Mo cluster-binding NifX family protein